MTRLISTAVAFPRNEVTQAAVDKRMACDVDRLIAVDKRRRELQVELDAFRTQVRESGQRVGLLRNAKSQWYKRAIADGKTDADIKAEADKVQAQLADVKPKIKKLEEEEGPILEEFDRLMLTVPQPADRDVPIGKDETENVELRKVGEPRKFEFQPKDHVTLGTELDIIDIEGGVKLAGSRNYILKGDGALLLEFALDLLRKEGVSVLPGEGFGRTTRRFIRLSLTHSVDGLEKAFDRIERFVISAGRGAG